MVSFLLAKLAEVCQFVLTSEKFTNIHSDCKWIARHNTVRAHTEAYRIYDKELGSMKTKCILDCEATGHTIYINYPIFRV